MLGSVKWYPELIMAYPKLLAEAKRLRRLANPKKYDNGSYQLIRLMGWMWWARHGFVREYRVGPYYIDMANPKLKWAIEADGAAYHMDVVKDEQRTQYLVGRGWYVQRFRWVELKRRPNECRDTILLTWDSRQPRTAAETAALRKLIDEQLRRSGFAHPPRKRQ